MSFDEADFKRMEDVGEVKTEKGKIEVFTFTYKGGDPKVKVQRVGTRANGQPYFGEMGNLTAEEAEKVGPLLVKAAKVARGK